MKRIVALSRLMLIPGLTLLVIGCLQSAKAQTPQSKPPQGAPTTTPPQAVPTPVPQQQAAATPNANPADVATIDSITKALYEVISGPAGQKRDWDRFRSLFAPGARMIPVAPQQGGGFTPRVLDVEGYITRATPFLEKEGFFEREISRRTEQYGHIAHLFSTYASFKKADDATPFARGINSIQLMNDGKRWWIVTIFWDQERAETPLPQKYLEKTTN